MKRIFGIWLLTAVFLVTLCACGKSTPGISQNASNPTSAAITSNPTEPEHTATLYLMTAGKVQDQYELGYSGELNAAQLLKGLTDLTGYHFDVDKVTQEGDKITVYWADTATFQPKTGTQAEPNQDLDLTFYDFDSELQFMLDSTYTTLTKNLGVKEVFFATASGGSLDFTEEANWKILIDQTYNGNFATYYQQTVDPADGDTGNVDKTAADQS